MKWEIPKLHDLAASLVIGACLSGSGASPTECVSGGYGKQLTCTLGNRPDPPGCVVGLFANGGICVTGSNGTIPTTCTTGTTKV